MYANFKTYVLSTVGDAPLCPENWCVARLLSTDRPKRGAKIQLWGAHMLEVSLPVEILQQPNFQLQTWMGGTWKANQLAVRRGILVPRRCGGGGVKSAVCALRSILRIGPRGVFLGVALGGSRGARAWALTVVV